MPIKYNSESLNKPIYELFLILEKMGERYSRNLLFRVYNEETKKSFSSFEKDFIRIGNAYSLFVINHDEIRTNNAIYQDLKKKFKKEWVAVK